MKAMILAASIGLLSPAAFAQTTIIEHDHPAAGVIIDAPPPTVVERRTVDVPAQSCDTQTKTKTNAMGHSKTVTKKTCN